MQEALASACGTSVVLGEPRSARGGCIHNALVVESSAGTFFVKWNRGADGDIDLAAANEAERQASHRYLTVAMDQIAFHAPVRVGDIVSLWAETLKVGKTSIRVRVKVLARARRSPHENEVTTAEVTMVAVDEAGRPIPIHAEPLNV